MAGLLAMSFGQEGIDRYIIVYKREYTPSEDEIHARRNGDEWNDDKAKEYVRRRAEQKLVDTEKAKKPEIIVPHSNYKDKYVHLIGQEAALEAAKKTESNKSYGFGKFILVQSVVKSEFRSCFFLHFQFPARTRRMLDLSSKQWLTFRLRNG